jgi:mannose-1-phosphate guanylyltransferase/mannose-6-phosphate isomerase
VRTTKKGSQMTIIPLLLCGGSGTRLWPLSRKSYPKQFASLVGKGSLFQVSAQRLTGPIYGAPLVITSDTFRFIVAEQLSALRIVPEAVLIEPEPRDTAAAILAAVLFAAETSPDALMLIAPSDHVIPDTAAFTAAVLAGVDAAKAGQIVTFGISPDRPETGFGYLELESRPEGEAPNAVPLLSFVEKPEAERAAQMLAEGRYLWNAGIFLASVATLLAAFRVEKPDLVAAVQASLSKAKRDLGFTRLDPAAWAKAEAISIDYAVMEKARNLVVVPYSGRWSDLGDWAAVWRETELGGLALSGSATAIDCRNTLLRSEVEGLEIIGIGLDDIVAVAMPDAVLVAHKDRTQEVKLAVASLKARNARQAESFPKDHRPWGWFESLVIGDRFQVKRIVVKPGGSLSLQSHVHRAEHWIVVEGTARVTVGSEVTMVTENQSVYVPLGAIHRLENPGKVPVALIEVQTGSYLGEDDIIRYEDVYSRM